MQKLKGPCMELSRSSPLAVGITWLGGLLTIVMRVVPHPANFAPVGALGIFGGAKLRSWHAFALPLLVMVASDLALWVFTGFDGNYSPLHISRAYVYASFVVYVALGVWLVRDRVTFGRLMGASLLGSLQFFLVTNFCEWLFQPLQSTALLPVEWRFSRDFSGLMACYAAALPFLQSDFPWDFRAFAMVGNPSYGALGTMLGDLVFTGVFFGVYGWVREPARQPELEVSSVGGAS
jgi:uncharacterized protein DUF6580